MNFTTTATTGSFCSCKSFEFRGKFRNCCHLDMIPIGIMKGKIVDVAKLPETAKKYSNCNVTDLLYTKEQYSI